MIKVVFFDIDNTLLDFEKCAADSIEKAFLDFEIPFKKNVVETFHEINEDLWRRIERGEISRSQLFDIRWQMILSKLGIDFNGHVLEKRFFSYLTNSAIPVDGAIELLKYLYPKYVLCVTSNAGYEQQVGRLQSVGMLKYIKNIFVSERIGVAKPDKAFFDACFLELNGVLPNETIIIGDSLTADIDGGRRYGIKTCWYNHKKVQPSGEIDADYVVDYLRDVEKIL